MRFLPVCALILALWAPAQTTPARPARLPADPTKFLQLAVEHNDIDVAGMPPWELKATFQLFDAKGVPTETLKLDEIWAGPNQQRQEWSNGSSQETTIVNHDGTFHSGAEQSVPPYAEAALQTIVHPVPEVDAESIDVTMQQQRFHRGPFNCDIRVKQDPAPVAAAGALLIPRPTLYCFQDGTANFGFTLQADVTFQANAAGMFQKRRIVTRDSILVGKVTRAQGVVDDLHTIEPPAPEVFLPGANAVKETAAVVATPAGVQAGRLIHRVEPVVPATFAGAKESLSVRIRIGKDGQVVEVKTQGSPDPELATAAEDAIRQWVFEPSTSKGKPVERETTVTVTFGQ